MRVDIQHDPRFGKIDHLFVLAAEGTAKDDLDYERDLRKKITAAISDSGFNGRSDETITLAGGSPRKITLLGIGKKEKFNNRTLRAALNRIARIARSNRDTSIAVISPWLLPSTPVERTTRTLVDLLSHADYRYSKYLTSKEQKEKDIEIHATYVPPASLDEKAAKKIAREALIVAESVRVVRDLGNAPGNEMTPTRLAERAVEVAKSSDMKCTVYDKKAIEKMKMGGLLAVNRGSEEEPRFVVMEYAPKRALKKICLVGKGITFDSGGISIKPADKMEEMKFDMAGAAAVIGCMRAIAELELPFHVYGIFASTENLPSGRAYKPGDIVTTMSGKTIEVINTDAEGRVILSDALHYGSTLEPDHMLDFATLTGACVVALGNEASGLFTSDDELARKLIESGDRVGERLWRLPEWDEYKEIIRSDWADVKNSGGRWGGAITAALFLKEFVNCPSWAHIDIAGTAWAEHENAREPKGATGVGVRLVVDFLRSLEA